MAQEPMNSRSSSSSGRAASRSCTDAGVTSTSNSRPEVSTAMCLLRPLTFLALSQPRVALGTVGAARTDGSRSPPRSAQQPGPPLGGPPRVTHRAGRSWHRWRSTAGKGRRQCARAGSRPAPGATRTRYERHTGSRPLPRGGSSLRDGRPLESGKPGPPAAARSVPIRHRWYQRGSGAGGRNPGGRTHRPARQGRLAPGLLVRRAGFVTPVTTRSPAHIPASPATATRRSQTVPAGTAAAQRGGGPTARPQRVPHRSPLDCLHQPPLTPPAALLES